MRKLLACTSLLLAFFITVTCSEDDSSGAVPKLTTLPVSNIELVTAESGGNITSDGGSEITARGVCWSVNNNPTITDTKSSDGIGTGEYTSSMILLSGTTYFVRAYATNKSGTGYGNTLTFTTETLIVEPTVTTDHAIALTKTTASVGGDASGNGTISERGVCWGLTDNPTTANNKITNGTGEGNISITLTGLLAGTQYYARAYAINEAGTSYGESISFKTKNQFSGVYEIVGGSIVRNTATGPDPLLSGEYVDGIEIDMEELADNAVSIALKWKNGGGIAGIDQSRVTINTAVTSPDGSHPVTISSPVNATLMNTAATENKFFPGLPGTAGASVRQEFLLNCQFTSGTPPFSRIITDLRLRNVDLD